MHIPDGLMDPTVVIAGWLLAMAALVISVRVVNKRIERRSVPLMAMLAAAIFVAQMLNFPIGGGTTGHLVGAALAGYLLGPFAGMLVMFTVLLLQCLMFGDGGVTALGLNMFNMAIIGCLLGYYVPKMLPKKAEKAGIFAASWLAVFIGATVCASELFLSYEISGGAYGISGTIAFPAMMLSHALIGIGEGLLTTGTIMLLAKVAPGVLKIKKATMTPIKRGGVDV